MLVGNVVSVCHLNELSLYLILSLEGEGSEYCYLINLFVCLHAPLQNYISDRGRIFVGFCPWLALHKDDHCYTRGYKFPISHGKSIIPNEWSKLREDFMIGLMACLRFKLETIWLSLSISYKRILRHGQRWRLLFTVLKAPRSSWRSNQEVNLCLRF